ESGPFRARGGSGQDTPRLVAGTNRSRVPPSGGERTGTSRTLGGASGPRILL
ncbi:unnamed protein product, partial [Gulo gulo]